MTDLEKRIIIKAASVIKEHGDDVVAYVEGMNNLTHDEVKYILNQLDIEYSVSINDVIQEKIEELSAACRDAIENGVDVEINNELKHFSYSLDSGDQGNIDDIFNMALQSGLEQPYHADGEECTLFTPKQIFFIYASQKVNKTAQITYFNYLKAQIIESYHSDSDIDTVKNITYGVTELIEPYKSSYDSIMAQIEAVNMSMYEKYFGGN